MKLSTVVHTEYYMFHVYLNVCMLKNREIDRIDGSGESEREREGENICVRLQFVSMKNDNTYLFSDKELFFRFLQTHTILRLSLTILEVLYSAALVCIYCTTSIIIIHIF